jgi:hypothetical protein
MTYWEFAFIYQTLNQHGYKGPMLDLGGVALVDLPDYNGDSGIRGSMRLKSDKKIWDFIDVNVDIDHQSEEIAKRKPGAYHTIVSNSTLEHTPTPWDFFRSVETLLAPGGLAIIVTVFEWPHHGGPGHDFFRFTDDGLLSLLSMTGLSKIDVGRHSLGPARSHAWIIASKGPLGPRDRAGAIPTPALDQFTITAWK